MLLFFLACTENKTILDSADPNQAEENVWANYRFDKDGPFSVGHTHITHRYIPVADQAEREITLSV